MHWQSFSSSSLGSLTYVSFFKHLTVFFLFGNLLKNEKKNAGKERIGGGRGALAGNCVFYFFRANAKVMLKKASNASEIYTYEDVQITVGKDNLNRLEAKDSELCFGFLFGWLEKENKEKKRKSRV